MRKLSFILPLVVLLVLILAAPVIAAGAYRSEITISDTSDTNRTGVPVLVPLGIAQAVELGYLDADGSDTRLFEGTQERYYMVAGDRIGILIPTLSANQERLYGFETEWDTPGTFGVIVGEDGYVTILDDTNLELGSNFEIEQKGWVDTSSGSDKNLVYKEDAFETYISAEENITSQIFEGSVETFYSSTSDDDPYDADASYTTARNSASADGVSFTGGEIRLGQRFEDSTYHIFRGFVFFDTSTIPDNAVITSVKLSLYGSDDDSVTDFDIVIQNGQPTYPHDPLVVGDYNRTYYSGDGGSLNTSGFTISGYNNITLNSDGLAWINVTGTTKLCLRSSRDIAGTEPTGDREYVNVYEAEEAGTDKDPKLTVDYIVPLATVTVTGVSSGELIIETTADGADLTLSVTNYVGTHQGNSPQSVELVSVPDNDNDWILVQNNVMPYMEYYKHTVSGTLIAQYQPNTIILGEEYSTETATFENGSDAVVGDTTVWTEGMVGSLMRSVDDDSIWFVVESVEDTTHLTLATNYSDTGGAGHTYSIKPRLIDREGAPEDGAITWGTNADLDVGVGGLKSISSYTPEGTEEGGPPEILPIPGEIDLWGEEAPVDIPWLPSSLITPAATLLGWGSNTLIGVLIIFAAVVVRVGVAIATGSALLAAIAVGVGLAVGAGTGAVGWWVVLVYAIFGGTYMVVVRSM